MVIVWVAYIVAHVGNSYNKNNITMILDRGFSNIYELSSKVNRIAMGSSIKNLIYNKYELNEPIRNNSNVSVFVITCKQGKDQLLHDKNTINLTINLANHYDNPIIYEIYGDHWSPIDSNTWNTIKNFLTNINILQNYTMVSCDEFPQKNPTGFRISSLVYKFLQ